MSTGREGSEAGPGSAGTCRRRARQSLDCEPGSDAAKPARGWYSRGYLPHFDGGPIPQAVTFRLADSLPEVRLAQWREELGTLPEEAASVEYRRRVEAYLDRGTGSCWLRNPRVAEVVQGALLFFDGERYRLHAWVVMPNHVHALFTPTDGYSIGGILHSWKSFTGSEANRVLGRMGLFWQADFFDRYTRNEEHFLAEVDYIEMIPVKAGLCDRKEEWGFSSARFRLLADGEPMEG